MRNKPILIACVTIASIVAACRLGDPSANARSPRAAWPTMVEVFGRQTAAMGEDGRSDLAKMQGQWQSINGPTFVMEIRGDRIFDRYQKASGKVETQRGKIRLNEATQPRQLDRFDEWYVEVEQNPSRSGAPAADENFPVSRSSVPAIYRLDGDDLTICWGSSWTSRPSQFKEQPWEGGNALITLRRIPNRKPPRPSAEKCSE